MALSREVRVGNKAFKLDNFLMAYWGCCWSTIMKFLGEFVVNGSFSNATFLVLIPKEGGRQGRGRLGFWGGGCVVEDVKDFRLILVKKNRVS